MIEDPLLFRVNVWFVNVKSTPRLYVRGMPEELRTRPGPRPRTSGIVPGHIVIDLKVGGQTYFIAGPGQFLYPWFALGCLNPDCRAWAACWRVRPLGYERGAARRVRRAYGLPRRSPMRNFREGLRRG